MLERACGRIIADECDTGRENALRIVGTAFAGDVPLQLRAGTAIAIATGAALPGGADAVVPIEVGRQR